MDVAFYGSTAYALVSVVAPSFPADLFACNPNFIGIYRVNGPSSSTLVADIGTFACDNLPSGFPIAVPTGVQYALEPFRGGFLVTDGHHNRVYRVTLYGTVTQMIQFGDVVPTGLAVSGKTIYMAEPARFRTCHRAGRSSRSSPGRRARPRSPPALASPWTWSSAAGARCSRFRRDSSPAPTRAARECRPTPTPGAHAGERNGTMTTIGPATLDQPTSLEIIGNTAYVVTLNGEIWKIDGIAGPPYGG